MPSVQFFGHDTPPRRRSENFEEDVLIARDLRDVCCRVPPRQLCPDLSLCLKIDASDLANMSDEAIIQLGKLEGLDDVELAQLVDSLDDDQAAEYVCTIFASLPCLGESSTCCSFQRMLEILENGDNDQGDLSKRKFSFSAIFQRVGDFIRGRPRRVQGNAPGSSFDLVPIPPATSGPRPNSVIPDSP